MIETNNIQEKIPSSRSIGLKATKARRKDMVIKVFSFNIQKNKLSKSKRKYLALLKLEAKYYYNYLVSLSHVKITDNYGDIVYPNNLFNFNTKCNLIQIFNYEDNTHVNYELKIISSQVKQEILKKIQSSIKGLSSSKFKGRKIGQLKFKSFVNIPLKQFNNSFYLSDDCKKLSLQGNKKTTFHLIKNKNISTLARNLQLTQKSITTVASKYSKRLKAQTHNNVSLKKLLDLNIIEIANAEITSSHKKDTYALKLTIYINPTDLEKANLFQGTQLSEDDLDLFSRTQIGLDAGITSEITVNCNEAYASISINSRQLISKFQKNKAKRLKRYQKRINRYIAKSKKAKKNNNSQVNNNLTRNNSQGFYTGKFKELKLGLNNAQTSMNNHKTDSVAKLTSIFDLFKKITFQDEMIKSWHQNKTFNFSTPIQKGILGKTYAKLKLKYDSNDNITIVKNNNGETDKSLNKDELIYHYQKLSKSLRTTKTCICANLHKNVTLKDRVYICEDCGYFNDRDTHSSYTINNTLNHVNYDYFKNDIKYKEIIGCGAQSKDLKIDYKDLILDSNLGQITTSIETNKIYHIFLSKLKSQNLSLTFNHEVVAKNILEAPLLV
jgi:rubrerythrin